MTGHRAVGYARVSTDDQGERGYSLPEQREQIAEHCRRNGLTLLNVISDDFTGRVLTRPGLNRVSALAEIGAFDCLVCVKLDRLARANHLRQRYEEWLAQQGVRTEFAEQSFEPTPSGRLQKSTMGAFSEYESETTRERTSRGRLRKATSRGVMPCNCPVYGYHHISRAEARVSPELAGRSGELIVVEKEAAVVRRIFSLYAAGHSLRGIARTLNQEGCRTRSGKLWSLQVVRTTIQNEAYVGRLYFGKVARRMTDELTAFGKVRKRSIKRPRAEWIELPCLPLIDEALFQTCQALLADNQARLGCRPLRTWLLHGTLFCGLCRTLAGKPRSCCGHVRHQEGKPSRYYSCSSADHVETEWCGTRIDAAKIEENALDALRRAAQPHWLADFARRDAEECSRFSNDPQEAVKRVCEALAEVDAEESRVADLLLAGISRPVVQGKIDAIHAQRDQLNRELAVVRTRLAGVVSPEQAAERGEAAGAHLRKALPEAEKDPKLLQQLFRLFLEIRIFPAREPQITVRVPVLTESYSSSE